MSRQYWLLKSEPAVFSMNDLAESPKQTTAWDGVRNYQARNFIRDNMQVGDLAFFYHSNAEPKAIVGVLEVVKKAYPDPTQFDPVSPYFDAKSTPAKPIWFVVDVKLRKTLTAPVTLSDLKANPNLANMHVVQRGSRLSVHPVKHSEWLEILKMAGEASASLS